MTLEPRATLLLVLHLAAATAVAVHVLLRKRDVGASISWIGLALLAPLTGSLLYLVFGINRVRRRARRLQRPRLQPRETAGPVPDARPLGGLFAALGRITERPIAPGNTFHPLENGDAAYPPMLAAIDGATASVALTCYIFRADSAGERFIAALSRARARGVTVRVLVDGVGSGYLRSAAYAALRRRQVPVRRFLHSFLPWRMSFLNLRSHKKLLVVDGRQAFIGGLNIGDENVLSGAPAAPVHDTHFAVAGPVVHQLMADFAEDWLFVSGERLSGDCWFPHIDGVGQAGARVVTSGPDQDLEKRAFALMAAIAAARRSIRIATPYFLPDERIGSGLVLAALSGVTVDIVVPSHGKHPILDWAMNAEIGPMLDAGCRIWRAAPPFDHAKLLTIDGAWSLLGSGNWDARSLRLNFELDLEVHDTALAEEIARRIDARLQHRVTCEILAARPTWAVLRDAAVRLLLPYL